MRHTDCNATKILLVDDSNTAVMMERMILKGSNFDILVAKDGLDAIDKARANKPDLILMDVVMPRLDGFETCKRLRANDSTRSIPIIMVTTRAEEQHMTTGFECGCNDYVVKPIDGLELLSKIRNLIGA